MPPSSANITSHYCRVGTRFVHYRCSGQGPPVVLLHQTPQSSRAMEPLMRALGPHCTSIAIDTPGFGLSDPLLGETWSVEQLSTALAETLDSLGVARAAFCGQHTGATIAADFARRWPERVVCLAVDGYTVFSHDEVESVLPHQLYRFVPRGDGTHLQWAWSRFRDGWMFFPWSVRSLSARRMIDMPSTRTIHETQIMELLRSRENHRAIYPGVFAWDGLAVARSLRVPTLLAGSADDQLYPHLDRLHGLPNQVEIARFPNGARAALLAAQAAFVKRELAAASRVSGVDASWSAPRDTAPSLTAEGRCRIYAAGLAMQAENLRGDAPKLVILHGAGSAGELELPLACARHTGPALAIDLPGHGNSRGPVLPPAESGRQVLAALDALGVDDYALWGRGLGAAVAVEVTLARATDGRPPPQRLHLSELRVLDEAEQARWTAMYAPVIEPQWDGGHLLRVWHELRDRALFHPWFERDRAHIRPVEPALDPELLTQQLFAALRCSDWPLAHRYWFEWPTQRLRGLACPVEFHAQPGDGWGRDLPLLRSMAP